MEGKHPQACVPRARKGSPVREAKSAGDHSHKVRKVRRACNCPVPIRSAGAQWAAGWPEGPALF